MKCQICEHTHSQFISCHRAVNTYGSTCTRLHILNKLEVSRLDSRLSSFVIISYIRTLSICAAIFHKAIVLSLLMYSKNTFHQGVCNDGGSHVETSSICVVPPLWALYRLVVSSITWGSQAQPLFYTK